MKWISKQAWLICFTLTLLSCGKKIGEKTSAPRNDQETGVIASCTSRAEANRLAQRLGIQFRVINEKRKLIEYIGIKPEELKKHLPHSRFKTNKIYPEVLVSGDFAATSSTNYPFYGAHQIELRNPNAARYFSHLDQIDALASPNLGESAKIAIIDTGVYYNHPHLSPNIYTNIADLHGADGDGADNDGNGYVDDYAGWDFYNGDAYPIDDHGHGTHVAGLAASTYSGVAPRAKILPVKVLGSDGRGDLGTIAAGILYAIDRGVDIINMSLGGESGGRITAEIRELIDTVKIARENNVLIIAAAGNGGRDGLGDCNDASPVYPANIAEDNVIAVASVNRYNQLTDYSNFGGETVHIAAPGGDYYTGGLYSTGLPNCWGSCSASDVPYVSQMGTSMATPVVAGVVALMKTKYPQLNFQQIKAKLLAGGTELAELDGLIKSKSVVNVQKALQD